MSDQAWGMTRRDLLRGAAGVALTGAGAWSRGEAQPCGSAGTGARARVVLVRDPRAIDAEGHVNGAVLGEMLDKAVTALLQEPDPSKAWARLFRPKDIVGIKSNEWTYLPTPPQLESAIKARLLVAGVPEGHVAIGDRGVLRNQIFQRATALINVRPLRTHHWSGIGGVIKNYIMFSEDPSSWHDDSCARLAGLWDLPLVKGKTRLNVLVMLTPLFHGRGPHHFNKAYLWPYKGMLVGTDPVAVDATGLRILEAKRRAYFSGEQPLAVSPKHVRLAQERFRLGVADPSCIDLVRVGWMEDALI
jgi:hypothetical protein